MYILVCCMLCCRTLWGPVEHGVATRSVVRELCGQHWAVLCLRCMGSLHPRHPRHDGRTLGLPAHTATSLVSTWIDFSNLNTPYLPNTNKKSSKELKINNCRPIFCNVWTISYESNVPNHQVWDWVFWIQF